MRYLALPRYQRLRKLQAQPGWQYENAPPVYRAPIHHLPLLVETYACREFLARARRAIQTEQVAFDLVHAHWAYRSGYVAARLAQIFRKPFVLTVQGSDLSAWLRERRKRARVRKALQMADAIIALNNSQREALCNEDISSDKIYLIPQGVDTKRFTPGVSPVQPELTRRFAGAFIYLCVANHYPVKGIDVLLQALQQMDKNIAVVLVGSGPQTAELEKLAHALCVEERIHFAGAQSPETIPHWLNACDALVIPSRQEGGPAVLLEALACGKPVVATRVGMAPEVLGACHGGLLVPVDSSEALAHGMQKLREQAWNPQRLREYALQYDWREIAQRVEEVYRKVHDDESSSYEVQAD